MIRALVLLGALSLAVSCFDFGLDERQFRCTDEPSICGEGMFCQQPEGICVPDDGRELCGNGVDDDGDDQIDCIDEDCGDESCDDDNVCTDDMCASDGDCQNDPVLGDMTCGIGCMCKEGVEEEIVCTDREDNDRDELIDCQDPDCADNNVCAGDASRPRPGGARCRRGLDRRARARRPSRQRGHDFHLARLFRPPGSRAERSAVARKGLERETSDHRDGDGPRTPAELSRSADTRRSTASHDQ